MLRDEIPWRQRQVGKVLHVRGDDSTGTDFDCRRQNVTVFRIIRQVRDTMFVAGDQGFWKMSRQLGQEVIDFRGGKFPSGLQRACNLGQDLLRPFGVYCAGVSARRSKVSRSEAGNRTQASRMTTRLPSRGRGNQNSS